MDPCKFFIDTPTEFSPELCEDVGVGVTWEELLTTLKHLCSTYLRFKGICSLKALEFDCLKYTGKNTALYVLAIRPILIKKKKKKKISCGQ